MAASTSTSASNTNTGEQQEEEEPFAVTRDQGFLPVRDPLRRLPPTNALYTALESLGDELPKLLVCGNDTLRWQITQRLPASLVGVWPEGATREERERALLLLSFIAHAFVWGRPDSQPAEALPDPLATLWIQVAEARGGRLPILTYASFNLYNWRRIDPEGPVDLGNICCLTNFLSGLDEEHFRLVHVAIEAKAVPAVAAMLRYAETGAGLVDALEAITVCLQQIQQTLARMGEGCDPLIYYKRVREYMGGWRNNPRLPRGLVYGSHGVKEFYGETGAQSAIIPAFDAFLGIVHEMDQMREYLLEMRRYMPRPHVAFIERLEALDPSVRERVLDAAAAAAAAAGESGGDGGLLVAAYDTALESLARFRARHLVYADRYIKRPAQQQPPPSPSSQDGHGAAGATTDAAAEVGTGGSDFVPYLEKHHRETKAHYVAKPPR